MEWRDYLERQRRLHGKTLFTVTELANVAGTSREAVNVEISRLLRRGWIVRYSHGRYGAPGAVTEDTLLRAIDPHAYRTGLHALAAQNLVAQVPSTITCFTDKRSPRARIRATPVGRFVLVCVKSPVYNPPDGAVAGPEQALCDYVYLCRRSGASPQGQVTFRGLDGLRKTRLLRLFKRYPATVERDVRRLLKWSP